MRAVAEITFEAHVYVSFIRDLDNNVGYPRELTYSDVKGLLEKGLLDVELVMPIGIKPLIKMSLKNPNKAVFVEDLKLPTRTINALKKAGYHTKHDVLMANSKELSDLKNIGHTALKEIIEEVWGIPE